VHRRARMDVAEGRHAIVLMDDIGRQLAGDDALEQRVGDLETMMNDVDKDDFGRYMCCVISYPIKL
jgi:hypothetical protein